MEEEDEEGRPEEGDRAEEGGSGRVERRYENGVERRKEK